MNNDRFFREAIFKVTGRVPVIKNADYPGGGCINNAAIVETDDETFFIKFNTEAPADMFETEFRGLKLLQKANMRVPEPLGYGRVDNTLFILLKTIKSDRKAPRFWENFGAGLALMHKNFGSSSFGLEYDNYIGRLPQVNKTGKNWIDFFINNRLDYQLLLAYNNRLIEESMVKQFHRFYNIMPDLLPVEKPALLHGDLWAGNFMTGNDGYVILIDPAVYYGHREIELSFTRMFGGFDEKFYASYNEEWPLEKDFDQRVDIYNLYPTLVHLNLFGVSYLPGITRVLDRYI